MQNSTEVDLSKVLVARGEAAVEELRGLISCRVGGRSERARPVALPGEWNRSGFRGGREMRYCFFRSCQARSRDRVGIRGRGGKIVVSW